MRNPVAAQRCMPVSKWPLQDQALREQALAVGDLIDGEGLLAGYRPATLTFLDRGYGRWLTWLEHRGELDPTESPAARLTPQRGSVFVKDLLHINSTKTVRGRLAGLYYMIRALDPGHDLNWVRDHIARVRANHRPVRNKYARIVGVDELWRLGLRLMEAAAKQCPELPGAAQFRDGLLISTLAACPIRTENMRTLKLDESFVYGNGQWWIRLASTVTKTKKPFVAPLPDELNASIAEYLTRYRPILLDCCRTQPVTKEAALWISSWGRPMSNIYMPVTKATHQALGKSVNPHLFRDCAATFIAMSIPEDVRITAPVLGHANLATSEREYNQAGSYQAAQLWQEHVLALRRQPLDPFDDAT